ncbi:MAG: GNAT family protein [Actinomycetaceae bacterium]|nr:GNAT family protein [Actinomycetaceae bacterium]
MSFENVGLGRRFRRRIVIDQLDVGVRGLLRPSRSNVDYEPDRVELRELRGGDHRAVEQLRQANRIWLTPWEASSPEANRMPLTMERYVYQADQDARNGVGLMFGILVDGELLGQISLSSITRGSGLRGSIGYWVAQSAAGRGLAPLVVAMLTDWAIFELGLHRIEIFIRPENAASLRVVDKLGLRLEGYHEAYMHINGQWADHLGFAVVREEIAEDGGLVARLERFMNLRES